MKNRCCFSLLLFLLLLPATSRCAVSAPRSTLMVSAAASMKDALTEISQKYPHAAIKFNFGGSGTLQRQIENGAPVDVFIAAADKNMDELQRAHLIDAATRRVLARNRLVLIVPKHSKLKIHSFGELKNRAVTNFAIGAPQSVPAGRYAQQVLSKLGIWTSVESKAVRGKDVRAVLTQAELGNVDAGIVYRTDAAISAQVKVVATAPETAHAPIRYPLAVVAASTKQNAAKKFTAFLQSATAKRVLRRYGFIEE